jgi:hypothetical protein
VSIPLRVLLFLLALRLLLPPGICICKVSSPASRALAAALGNESAPLAAEDDDDTHHDDGCPASPLKEGMGLRPAGPGPIELPLTGLLPVLPDPEPVAALASALEIFLDLLPRPPLCVSHCALRC